jgi:serum/glucocorticoid-regulated kinase 2
MKEMLKARVMHKKSIQSVMNELKLLSMIQSRFIVNAHYAFQDQENLYLVMDLLLGGDLRFHLARKRKFTMEQTKFFIACLVQALESVHGNGIIHRDIKPENMVFDENGYLKLTDFGIAREWLPEIDNSNETSGTPGYMAPEVMCKNNHGMAADFFAVGVIAWECMLGRRPYVGKSRREIRDAILAKQAQIRKNDVPSDWSLEAADFINKCLARKASSRLGYNGIEEVKNHPWF